MTSIWPQLEPLLAKVQKPARYIGCEDGAIEPHWHPSSVSWLLTYPDTYEIGLPNQGLQILYDILNSRDDALAERAYAPWLDLEAELTQAGSVPAPEEELELGEIDDADLDFLAQAAAEPERSHHDAMLAKTGDAIARAAAELDLAPADLAADNGDFAGFELDLDRDVPDTFDLSGDETPAGAEAGFDLPLGELELGEPAAPAEAEDADLAFLQGTDETETKLELARAYLDMGDLDGARDILGEVTEEGSPEQREQAAALLERIRLS